MSIAFQDFQFIVSSTSFPNACFLRNAFFLRKHTNQLVFLACVGLSPPCSSFISCYPSRKTYYPANPIHLRRSFSPQFLFYSLSSLAKDLLSRQIPSTCVGLSPPSSSFIPSHPSQKTYYPANPIHLRRSFSFNILFYHFNFSSINILIYIITISVQAFSKYYLLPVFFHPISLDSLSYLYYYI